MQNNSYFNNFSKSSTYDSSDLNEISNDENNNEASNNNINEQINQNKDLEIHNIENNNINNFNFIQNNVNTITQKAYAFNQIAIENDIFPAKNENKMLTKVIFASIIGNMLEWFEYCLYGQFAVIISQTFFPKNELAVMLTWLIFAAGFITRPLGGVILGIIGDKFGRKSVLSFSIIAMSLPTLGIGLLPGYENIGIVAPIMLLIFRCIQGFSMGGEFSSCITYMIESSPKEKRALIGSFAFISMCLGILLGILSLRVMSYYLSEAEIKDFGWRIPFISGIFMGGIGLYIRKNLSESPIYQKMKKNAQLSKSPIKDAFKSYKDKILLGAVIYMSVTTNFYMFAIYLQSLLQMKYFSYSYNQIINISGIGLIALSFSLFYFSNLADKIGRKQILILGLLGLSIVTPFSLYLFSLNNVMYTYFAQSIICIFLGAFMAPVPTVLVEIFPANIRFTCIGISYNLSAAVFGGTLPIIASFLISSTNSPAFIQYYLLIINCITLYFLVNKYKETQNVSIE